MSHQQNLIKKLFSNTVFLLNIGTVLWLVLCYAASIAPPDSFRFIALFSLTTPFALAANFFFVFFWLISSKKWRTLLSVIALALFHTMIPAVFGYHYFAKNDWGQSANSFKVMSWNTHGMGIYIPSEEKTLAKDIVAMINRENPDILCLPEFSVNVNPSKNKNLRQLINEGGYKEYRINTDHVLNEKMVIGTAILSKRPVVRYKVYDLNPEIYLLECDVQMRADAIVRIYVLHLHSFMLSDDDKAYLEKLKRNGENIKKSRPLFSRLDWAYVQRGIEADKVAAIVSKSPYPSIICGDFNDLPFSYTYCTIKGKLTDAFAQKGKGLGRTYNQIVPTLRIDHIFYSSELLDLNAFKTIQTQLSDHNPIVANFDLKSKKIK